MGDPAPSSLRSWRGGPDPRRRLAASRCDGEQGFAGWRFRGTAGGARRWHAFRGAAGGASRRWPRFAVQREGLLADGPLFAVRPSVARRWPAFRGEAGRDLYRWKTATSLGGEAPALSSLSALTGCFMSNSSSTYLVRSMSTRWPIEFCTLYNIFSIFIDSLIECCILYNILALKSQFERNSSIFVAVFTTFRRIFDFKATIVVENATFRVAHSTLQPSPSTYSFPPQHYLTLVTGTLYRSVAALTFTLQNPPNYAG